MMDSTYYRTQATRARRLAETGVPPDVVERLQEMAQDYEDIAVDLELGAIEIRHPELMPQTSRHRELAQTKR